MTDAEPIEALSSRPMLRTGVSSSAGGVAETLDPAGSEIAGLTSLHGLTAQAAAADAAAGTSAVGRR